MDFEAMGARAADAGRIARAWCQRVLSLVKTKGGPMISMLIGFLATTAGRWSAIALMLVAAWFGFARHYEKKGMSRVTAQIEKKVTENVEKADAARKSVDDLPADRLRDKYFRD